MKKFITNKYVLFILGTLFLIGLWFLISLSFDVDNLIFPNPVVTFLEVGNLLKNKQTYEMIFYSLVRLIIGFILSFVIAFILGTIVNNNKHLYNFLKPIITFFKSVPTATVVFIFIVITGVKYATILVVILITFPILYESVIGAYRNTEKAVLESADVDGTSKFKKLFKLQLPLGFKHIAIGLTSSFSLAFKVEIMAEVIMGYTKGGIGAMIKNSTLLDPTNLTTMFAYSFIVIFLMLIVQFVSFLVKDKIEKKA